MKRGSYQQSLLEHKEMYYLNLNKKDCYEIKNLELWSKGYSKQNK